MYKTTQKKPHTISMKKVCILQQYYFFLDAVRKYYYNYDYFP